MNNLSTTLKRTSLVVGLIITGILVCAPTGAGEVGMTFPITLSGLYAGSPLNSNYSLGVFPSDGTKLTIPLTGSISLDLSLSSFDTGQAITRAEPFGAAPIPVAKPSEFGLRSYRLGAGFNFRF
jgi:hypothetical protein